jgi:hypothetical protein
VNIFTSSNIHTGTKDKTPAPHNKNKTELSSNQMDHNTSDESDLSIVDVSHASEVVTPQDTDNTMTIQPRTEPVDY